jgi:hypothetical protein
METLQDCNRRQKNIKIEVNHLAFNSRNERAIITNQPRTNSTSSKMTITSTHQEKEEFSPSRRHEDDIYSDQTEVQNRPF